jgi:hypothetical protein
MKNKNPIMYLLLAGVGFGLGAPVLLSAEGLPYPPHSLGAQNSFIHKVQKIGEEDFASKSRISSYEGEVFKGHKESDTGMRSYSEPLGPSFDNPSSAKGESTTPSQSLADPSVKALSEMDMKGGFTPPGSYTGSPRRF